MGSVERREREREEVRRRILDAARDLFNGSGYDSVTMRAVADAIEYSPTAIYHHFEDKDDLVKALCHEDFARLLHTFETTALPDDPIERIRALGRAYAAFGLANPNQYRFMFMTPNKFEEPPPPDEPGVQSFGMLRAAVAAGIDSGRLRADDPQAAAQVLWASLHGVVALLITLRADHWPQGAAAPDLVERVMESSLCGLLAAPAAPVRRKKKE